MMPDADVVAAFAALGKRRVVLAIHDASFPATPGADAGRGTPYSAAARAFARFVRRLGFDGLMLGPQGVTSRANPSPYDATLFSRNPLNIDFAALAGDPLFAELAAVRDPRGAHDAGSSARVHYTRAFDVQGQRLAQLHEALLAARAHGAARVRALNRALAAFRAAHADWLEDDALYFALAARHGHAHHRDWPDARDRELMDPRRRASQAGRAHEQARRGALAQAIERHALGQMIVHRQHAAWRVTLAGLGLRSYADLQVGLSPCDVWQREHLFLSGYLMGAPPSRTNPAGQPWGYRVLDPDLYHAADGGPGPALDFLRRRIGKLLAESDGLRVDHPHGLVCPWVYRADDPDPHRAVRAGARLHSSPALPGHRELARHAIARAQQLADDPAVPRHADRWVRELDAEQVARYGVLFDLLAAVVREGGGSREDLVCEVLSTCPYPLARVMAAHGLGRFRVTQKADLQAPGDVYRSENARPEDWIMVGNHDTVPIRALARQWLATGEAAARAAYLAQRLCPDGGADAFAARLLGDPGRLVEAQFADAFASAAGQVLVFFPDLLGLEEVYNRPGVVHPDNWSLRVPADFAASHARRSARGEAVDLRRVLALALRARGAGFMAAHRALLARLEAS
jgi:4-alpha-glucanotransferase